MLHDLQRTFMQAIYRRHVDIEHILDPHRRTTQTQLDIYRNSIFGGLLKSLKEIYPVIQKLVGEEFFDALCLRYIARTPSCHPDINCYGQALADFTQTFPPAEALPYLPDVMRLEWAWHWALQTSSADPQALQSLLSMDQHSLTRVILSLHPTATLVRSPYPILTIWQANQPEYQGDGHVDLSQGGQDLLVWRHDNELHIDLLTGPQAEFLIALLLEQTLGEMQVLTDFESTLVTLLQRGYISNYQITSDGKNT